MSDPAPKIAAFDPKTAAPAASPSLLTSVPPPKTNTGGMVGDMLRGMPRSDDAERGVLSCFLQNPAELLNDAVSTVPADAFYHVGNRLLYEELLWFNNNPDKKVLDLVTLSQHLLDRGLMDKIGGAATLAELYNFVPTSAHYPYYCGILRDKLLLRRIIAACTESIQNTYEYEENVAGLLDRVEQRVLAVREATGTKDAIKALGQHVVEAIEAIQEMLQHPGMLRGLATGYPILDKITNGLQKTEMFIIAARPSMGKTSLAMNIVEHVAVVQKKAVAFFSLEMSATMLVRRLIVARAGVSMSRLQSGLLSKEEARAVSKACTELQSAQIFIDDTPGLDIMELRAKARRLKKQYNIDMVAVDYLQLLTSQTKRAKDNRQIEIAEISAGLKGLAKELDLPVMVLAQLNRAVEQRKGQRPMLSDLRESGSIEQDADVVGLLTRADYAGSKQEKEDEEEDESRKGEAELIIAKNRNGPTDDVPLRFIGEQMRFTEREAEASPER